MVATRCETLLGYRLWRLVAQPLGDVGIHLESLQLHSMCVHYLWPHRMMTSIQPPRPGIPGELFSFGEKDRPSYGIFAGKTTSQLYDDSHPWDPRTSRCLLSGQVQLLGRVAKHRKGYRAERALVRRINLPRICGDCLRSPERALNWVIAKDMCRLDYWFYNIAPGHPSSVDGDKMVEENLYRRWVTLWPSCGCQQMTPVVVPTGIYVYLDRYFDRGVMVNRAVVIEALAQRYDCEVV